MPRANVPEETANLDLVYSHGPWYGSLNYHYIGSEYVTSYELGITCTPDAPVATSSGPNPTTCRSGKLPGYGTVNLNAAYDWKIDSHTLKAVKLDLHVDNLLNNQSPFYSAGYDQTSNPSFMWEIYNLPMFVGLTATASFF